MLSDIFNAGQVFHQIVGLAVRFRFPLIFRQAADCFAERSAQLQILRLDHPYPCSIRRNHKHIDVPEPLNFVGPLMI